MSRTVSGVNPRNGPNGLAHHDGGVGVMFLHSRVCALQERPITKTWSNTSHATQYREQKTHLVAALCSEVWQKRKRSSFRPLVKAYLVDMAGINGGEWMSKKADKALASQDPQNTANGYQWRRERVLDRRCCFAEVGAKPTPLTSAGKTAAVSGRESIWTLTTYLHSVLLARLLL